nr:hypothetical protein [Tanacetum cinerariifolium]
MSPASNQQTIHIQSQPHTPATTVVPPTLINYTLDMAFGRPTAADVGDGTMPYDSNIQAFMAMPTSHRVALAEPYDVDYVDTFSSVLKPTMVRVILSLTQPSGFEDFQRPQYVCKLHKVIYGLKQDVVIYMLVYMDDIVIMESSQNVIDTLVRALSGSFLIKDLGRLHYFIGIEVVHNSGGITLMQHKYATDLLH